MMKKEKILLQQKIALVTDSMCDLPPALIEQFGIRVFPAKVIYPDREYSDRIDIMPDEVYARMPAEIPTTSQPALHEIKAVFEEIRREGFTHVLAIHISSALSGTYQTVKMAAREIEPHLTVKVIDTKTLSMGTGWVVLEAARNLARGLTFEKIVDSVNQLSGKVDVYYILETLEYLRRGGRIGHVASMIGEFLHLKPVIAVNKKGEYFTFCKAKGRKKSIEKLVEIVEAAVKESEINLAVLHGGAQQEMEKLLERLKSLPNIKEIMYSDISPVLGVHTGPGLLGIAFQVL